MENSAILTKGSFRARFEAPIEIKKWKVFVSQKSRMVLVRFTNDDFSWHTTPYNPELKLMVCFRNPDEWKLFEKQCKISFEIQNRLFPDKFIQQKQEAEKELEYIMSTLDATAEELV